MIAQIQYQSEEDKTAMVEVPEGTTVGSTLKLTSAAIKRSSFADRDSDLKKTLEVTRVLAEVEWNEETFPSFEVKIVA